MEFDKITMVPIRKVSKKYNICVLSLLMLYEIINIMIFKVLGSVVYCIMDNYICVDYYFLQKFKLSLDHKGFEITAFNDISGIGI